MVLLEGIEKCMSVLFLVFFFRIWLVKLLLCVKVVLIGSFFLG